MYLDELKCITATRAEKLTGIRRENIGKAMDLYEATNGRRGLKFIRESKRRIIRLCAIRDWLASMEKTAAYPYV